MMPGNRRAPKYVEGRAVLEYIRQPLYDRKQLAAAAAQTVTFFTNLGATPWNTNLTTPSMLPAPHTFDLFGISMFVQQGTALDDLENLYNNSYVQLQMSSKPYLTANTFMVPAAGGITGAVSTTVNNTTLDTFSNCVPSPLVYLPLDLEGAPLHIPSQQEFLVNLVTSNAVAFTATIDCWLYLHGIYGRPTT